MLGKLRDSISVVIPAYNEARRLPRTLGRVSSFLAEAGFDSFEILVVDDGSADLTAEKAVEAGVRLLRNETNRGKGYSVRRGMLAAQGKWILFSDADLSAPIEEVEKLLGVAQEKGVPCVIGSRALDRSLIGVRQPIGRDLAGRIFNVVMRLQTGLRFRDTQCGFKLFEAAAAREIFGRQRLEGFGFDVEVLYIADKLGYEVLEVPVRWNNVEGSKVRFLHGARSFLDPLLIRWNGLRGAYEGLPALRPSWYNSADGIGTHKSPTKRIP